MRNTIAFWRVVAGRSDKEATPKPGVDGRVIHDANEMVREHPIRDGTGGALCLPRKPFSKEAT
jgi:hypothetical protein